MKRYRSLDWNTIRKERRTKPGVGYFIESVETWPVLWKFVNYHRPWNGNYFVLHCSVTIRHRVRKTLQWRSVVRSLFLFPRRGIYNRWLRNHRVIDFSRSRKAAALCLAGFDGASFPAENKPRRTRWHGVRETRDVLINFLLNLWSFIWVAVPLSVAWIMTWRDVMGISWLFTYDEREVGSEK